MTRILVTGASGFLGRAVVKQLQAAGERVRATGRKASHPDADDYWPLDLTAIERLPELLEDVSCIIHCAGLAHQFQAGPEQEAVFHAINCEATKRLALAAAAQAVKRFVFVSSVSVYGPSETADTRNEDEIPKPLGPYASSKRKAELELLRIAAKTGLEVLILRMSTLYGEGDPGNLGRLIEAIRRGRFVMIGPGQNRKSLIHRDDAASACVRAALSPVIRSVGVWNVADEPRTMKDIVDGIAKSLGRTPPRWWIPSLLANGLLRTIAALGIGSLRRWAKSRQATVQKWLAEDAYDGSRFAKDFQWQPDIPLEAGLRQLALGKSSSEKQHGLRILPSLKRSFDFVAAAVLVLLLAVPMVVVAIAVKLTSRGPVLYWSDRVGRHNRIFRMPKFRSMCTDTPELPTHLLTDSRRWITPLGKLLRKTSLDELPQLWSILKGDMSFVGPRPALFNQADLIALRTEKGIHELTPGLTGWAQINGRDELPIPEKVAFDESYLRNRSFLWDMKILVLTALKVLRSEGVAQTGDADKQATRRAA